MSETTSDGDTLLSKQCIPCTVGGAPLPAEERRQLAEQLAESLEVVQGHHLRRAWAFDDFAAALTFTNAVGGLAEAEGHHPDIYLAWGKVEISIWTHKIDGLTESDFILAAKIDAL
jgi:4a-hydroxytetrahydrobiopterin dehydratase